jgi:putative DNA primase/helicase
MRSEWFTFGPVAKVWLGTNREPRIRDSSDAIWQRLKKIPFNVQFILKPGEIESRQVRIQDKNLGDKLKLEYPGILNWMIQGCIACQQYGFEEPGEVVAATKDYRENQNAVGLFIAECCEQNPDGQTYAYDFNSAFQKWCRDNGENGMPTSLVGKELERLGYGRHRDTTGKKRTFYSGLRLLESATQEAIPWVG